jgi:hypothetical protein
LRPVPFTPREGTPDNHLTGGWVHPEMGMVLQRTNLLPISGT